MTQTYVNDALTWLALGVLAGAAVRPFVNRIAGGRGR